MMAKDILLSPNDFLRDAQQFKDMSEKLSDAWEQIKSEEGTYLVYKQKISLNKDELNPIRGDYDVLQMEYHIVYSISYQVPMLYFQGHRSDGSVLNLDDAWRLFRKAQPKRSEMLSILTQMEHPILFKPFLALHPCGTASLLGQFQKSSNRILTFISLFGPYVNLTLNNDYGRLINEEMVH